MPVKVEHPPRVRSTESTVFGLSKSRWEHILEHPCAADVIKAIQTIASKNAAAYEAVFEHVPRDKMSEFAIVQNSFTLPYPLTFDAPSKPFKNERFPNAVVRNYRKEALIIGKEYVFSNSSLARATHGHMPLRAFMYYYDSKGRIARIEEGDFSKKRENAKIKICRKYDDQDRLLLFLNPRTTQICQPGQPDVRDEWIRYKYGEVGGKQVTVWDEWHHGDESGRWSKRFERFRTGFGADDIDGAASAKSHKGVTTIYGSNAGKLDDNSANTVLDGFGQGTGSTYQFLIMFVRQNSAIPVESNLSEWLSY